MAPYKDDNNEHHEEFHQHAEEEPEEEQGFKIHISRVPTKFTEETVQRILSDKFGGDVVAKVELILPRENEEGEEGSEEAEAPRKEEKTHRGFGFVTFRTAKAQEEALQLKQIKGGRKATSKKMHTIYLRPYAQTEQETNLCYLWSQHRCPYGDDCKFEHVGPGGTLQSGPNASDGDDADSILRAKKKKGKCFAFRKGKCDKGDACPFWHDVKDDNKDSTQNDKNERKKKDVPKSEKDCINWKTKGKCRKGDKCPYKHDVQVQKKALQKIAKKKAKSTTEDKEKQPLSIRVFGMNYETTEQDIRDFFNGCGPIQDVTFPIFEDSGRSKGYCGVWFSSPKAVAKAIELDGQELMGRWLRIQAGKMYLKQWEEHLHQQHQPPAKRARTISSHDNRSSSRN